MSFQGVLSCIHDAMSKAQFEQLQLGALCLDVPRGVTIDSTHNVSDVVGFLVNKYPNKGTTLLYKLLTRIGVQHQEVQSLLPFINSELKKNLKICGKLKFAKVCINVCTSMSEDDYNKFFSLCVAELQHNLNIEKFPTPASLLIELIKQGKISVKDVKFLCDKLEDTGLIQTLEKVQKYRQNIGSLAQEGSADQTEEAHKRLTRAVQEKGIPTQALELSAEHKNADIGAHTKRPNLTVRDHTTDWRDDLLERDTKSESHRSNEITSGPEQLHRSTESKDAQTSKELRGVADEKTLLLDSTKQKKTNGSLIKSCCICCGVFIFVLLMVAFASVSMIVIGKLSCNSVENSISFNTINSTHFAYESSCVLLGTIDSNYVTNARVSEVIQYGDESHVNYPYAVRQKDFKTYTIFRTDKQSISHEAYPSKDVLNYFDYSWTGSSFNLTVYAMNPWSSTGDGCIYVFDDKLQLDNYKNGKPFSAVKSWQLNIGTFNNSERTFFQYEVDRPAFYFIVIQTPTDLYYSYSFESKVVFVNHTDYEKKCTSFYQNSPCSFALSQDGLYHILAFPEPLREIGSPTTHYQLITSGVSDSAQEEHTKWKELTYGGVGVLVPTILCLFVIIVCIAMWRHSKTKRLDPIHNT